jgi:hypothetical protein
MKPYGYVRKDGEGLFIYGEHQFQNAMGAELVPVYLHPKEWVGLEKKDMPDGENPMFDHEYFIAGMVFAAKVLKEKNT